MKKTFVILFVMLSMLWSMGTSAQTLVFHLIDGTTADVELSSTFRMSTVGNKTIVSLPDGSTKEFTQSDILTVTYRETKGDVNRDNAVDVADIASIISIMAGENANTPNPSNAVLSSRLKDKDGNPILLEGIKLNDSWIVTYTYDEDGALTSYIAYRNGQPHEVYNVDGLTITSTLIGRSETRTIEMQFILNEGGLVQQIARIDYIVWTKSSTLNIDYLFFYNNERQLTGCKYDEIEHIDDGSQPEKHKNYVTTWTNGNPGDGSYSNENNICKQNLRESKQETCVEFDGPFGPLYMIGLFGVGPATLPSNKTYTLNPNGTIATEGDYIYYYK